MDIKFTLILIIFAICNYVKTSKVKPCKGGQPIPNDIVVVEGCDEIPWGLKRGSKVPISITLTPEKDAKNVIVKATGTLAGIKTPYPGVDGKAACNFLFKKDTGEAVGCDLKAGETYIYKNVLPVLSIAPVGVIIDVQWVFKNKDTKETISCFESKAKITT